MKMNIDQTRLFRVPLLCLVTMVCMGQLSTLAIGESNEQPTISPRENDHGNNGELLYLIRLDLPTSEESREAKDIVIPVFSPPRLRLDLFIPFNQSDLIRTAKKKLKPRVIRRIKLNRAKRRR